MIVDTNQVNLPSDPATIKKIKDALQEASASYTRCEGERDFQKDLFAELAKDTELPKAYLVRCAKIYHKSNVDAVQQDQEATISLYEKIFGSNDGE